MSIVIKHSIDAYEHDCKLNVTWPDMPVGSHGDAAGGAYAATNFVVYGTFGEGGSVCMEGSRDGEEWGPLLIPPLTAEGTFKPLGIASQQRFLRPRVTAGDHATKLTVYGFFATADASALR